MTLETALFILLTFAILGLVYLGREANKSVPSTTSKEVTNALTSAIAVFDKIALSLLEKTEQRVKASESKIDDIVLDVVKGAFTNATHYDLKQTEDGKLTLTPKEETKSVNE